MQEHPSCRSKQCRAAPSHPQAAAPGDQLGQVRCRPARSRQPDRLVYAGGGRGCAGGGTGGAGTGSGYIRGPSSSGCCWRSRRFCVDCLLRGQPSGAVAMSLRPAEIAPVLAATAQVVAAAFPKGCPVMRMRDELGAIYDDRMFASLYPDRGPLPASCARGVPPARKGCPTNTNRRTGR